jgi:hypothetical protein
MCQPLGVQENYCKGESSRSTLLRDSREIYPWQSAEGGGYSKGSCPVPKISALQKPWPARKLSAFDSPGSAAVIIFTSADIPELINLQNVNGKAKPYQVKQLLRLIERYNLQMEEEP